MPIYEYECPECGARKEVLQKLGEDGSALPCSQCSCVGLRKILSCCAAPVVNSASGSSCGSGCPAGGSGFA